MSDLLVIAQAVYGTDKVWTVPELENLQRFATLIREQRDKELIGAGVEPVAWDVYVACDDHGYLSDDLDDPQLVDDCTNSNAVVTPLYTAEALAARVAQMQREIGELKALSMEPAGIVRACIDRETALRDKVAQLEQDARRYRAIREGLVVDPDNSGIVVSRVDDFGGETLRGDAADAAIDAAMKGSGQ